MVDEANKGNMDSNIFITNIWKRILVEVNRQGKQNFGIRQFKQKFNKGQMLK